MAIDTRYGDSQTRGSSNHFIQQKADTLPFQRAVCFEYITELGKGYTLGSILAYPINTKDNKPHVFLPFFQSHIMLPVKPGEEVWTFSDGVNHYWITRISGAAGSEDPNFTHVDREFIETENDYTSAKDKLESKKYVPLFNNGPTFNNKTKPDSFIDQIDTTLFRPVPRNQPKVGDVILQSSHDATIKLGTELGKSGDNNFNTLSSVIDLHVGKSSKGTSIQNQLGALETNKVPNMLGEEFDLDEGMPDYENDLSRIYITESSQLDKMFAIPPIELSYKGNIGYDAGAGIVLKSNYIKSIGSKIDILNTNQTTGIVVDNDIQVLGDFIYLGYKNTEGEEPIVGTHELALEGMHPYVRWGFLKDYLEELNAILAEFAGTCEANKSPGYMSPNLELTQASITMKMKLDQLVQKFDPIPSARIYGE